jgi:chloramphenicol O-acetyltransferase type B
MFKQTKDILTKHKVGRWTYGVPEIKYDNKGGNLEIGAFCSIACGVQILLGGNHRMDWVTTYPFYVYWDSARYIPSPSHSKGDVIIKNDVWIGENVTILSGVTIGNGAVIGTSAVVAKNVPDYSVVVGNPAKVIRKRFDEETIERLLRIRWWNWSDQKIEEFLPLMLDSDISKFLTAAESSKE